MSVDKAEKRQEINNTEKIFMIEVVIQKLFIDVLEVSDLKFHSTETCLSYRFLDYGPFTICEKDFTHKRDDGGCAGCGILKNGNSTMFPLFPDQIKELQRNGFNLDVEILKMFKPIPRVIGKTEIPMKFIFQAVLETMQKKLVDSSSKSMKNRYKLKDLEGDPVGYVDLFIRCSSMGKIIITKFQMDTAMECMEFQSNTGTSYKYQKKPFPDPYICRPCGKPTKPFPPNVKESELPQDFPAFKITEDMKKRLQTRRYKELGIEPPPPPPPKKTATKPGQAAGKPQPLTGNNKPSLLNRMQNKMKKADTPQEETKEEQVDQVNEEEGEKAEDPPAN